MKRTPQVALLLMGVTAVGVGGYAMMPRNDCAAQPSAGMSAAQAPGDPCPSGHSSSSSSSSGGSSSRTSFSGSGSGSSDSSSHSGGAGTSHGGFGSIGASHSSGG
jgi:hypothetical protein